MVTLNDFGDVQAEMDHKLFIEVGVCVRKRFRSTMSKKQRDRLEEIELAMMNARPVKTADLNWLKEFLTDDEKFFEFINFEPFKAEYFIGADRLKARMLLQETKKMEEEYEEQNPTKTDKTNDKPFYKESWFWGIIGVILFFVGWALSG